jgi:hypothetical protein
MTGATELESFFVAFGVLVFVFATGVAGLAVGCAGGTGRVAGASADEEAVVVVAVEGAGLDFFGFGAGAGAGVAKGCGALVPSIASRKALRARICSSVSAVARAAENRMIEEAQAMSSTAQGRGCPNRISSAATGCFESFIARYYEKSELLAIRFA